MSDRTLEEKFAELEERIEGIELLLAHMVSTAREHPITAPDAARLVAEERYRLSPQQEDAALQTAAPERSS